MADEVNGGRPSKAAIDLGIHDAFVAEGYVSTETDGNGDEVVVGLNHNKRRQAIYMAATDAKALTKAEKIEKAIKRPDLVERVWPHLPDPTNALQVEVNRIIDQKYTWADTKSSYDGPVQRLVGLNMGNGYVLCRTKVGKGQGIDAIYVTDSLALIREDFTRPDNKSLSNKIDQATGNREMLIIRQPHNAAKYLRDYEATLVAKLEATRARLALSMPRLDEDEDEGEEPEPETVDGVVDDDE